MMDQSITLCGNLTKAVEVSADGVTPARARFRIAHNSRKLDSSSGEWKDGEALYMDVVCWRSTAMNVAATVGKGDPVVVVGRLRENSWLDDKNVPHSKFQIDADVVALDLRRGVTTRYQKVVRGAGENPAFQTQPEVEVHAHPDQAQDQSQDQAEPEPTDRELVGAGAEPPF